MEPQFNEPPYNEVFGITNDIPPPSNSEIYGKERRYMQRNLVIANIFRQSPGPLLNGGSNVVKQSPIGKNFDETTECQCKYSFDNWYLTKVISAVFELFLDACSGTESSNCVLVSPYLTK